MTQPIAHHSLALFRDTLLVDFVPVPASRQRGYVQRRDKAQSICATLAPYRMQLPDGHDPRRGFAATNSVADFFSDLKRTALRA
jgi:hypothetical protein